MQLNNNGISPVPAFSLGRPASMNSFGIKKGAWTFSPEYNFALDGKPWSINEWVRYQKGKDKWIYQFGWNLSQFFTRENLMINGKEIENVKLNRYTVLEGIGGYDFSEKISLRLMYWRNYGLDPDAVKSGNFVNLTAIFSKIKLVKEVNVTFQPSVFFIKNKIPFSGLFTSAIMSVGYGKIPFRVSVQAVQPLKTIPESDPNWNIGLNYNF